MTLAQAGRGGLARTTAAVNEAIKRARTDRLHLAVFVTGQPGAGKTLCGLDLAFAGRERQRAASQRHGFAGQRFKLLHARPP